MQSRKAFDAVVATLRAAGCVFAEDEATIILEAATSSDEVSAIVARRTAGEPLEVIVGWAEFCGLRVLVDEGVFVPRRRTSLLVGQAVAVAGPGSVVVDLCCGSGAVGAAIQAGVPGIELHASDLEPKAVRCARRNLEPLGGHVHEGDLFDALPETLRGRVDVLAVNAPYVPTDAITLMPPEARDHEPVVALDGGADGVDVHRRVADQALTWLAPGGHLLVETSEEQAPLTRRAIEAGGLGTTVHDSEDWGTSIVVGTRSSTA